MSLKSRFIQADEDLFSGKIKVNDPKIKMKLYGLAKQVKEGDCKMDMPPSTNTILRAKWEAWTHYAGMSAEAAAQAFLDIIETVQPSVDDTSNVSSKEKLKSIDVQQHSPVQPKADTSSYAAGSIRKQGSLYKQRDVFKGWRSRHFVLQDSFLIYYVDDDDTSPRNTLDLTGCQVTDVKPTKVGTDDYYTFVISHPKVSTTYILASESQKESEDWVEKIMEASRPISLPISASRTSTTKKMNDTPMKSVSEDVETAIDVQNIINPTETLSGIPTQFRLKLEKAVSTILSLASSTNGWENLYEKSGVIAKKLSGEGICVRGDSMIPFPMMKIIDLLTDPDKTFDLDPMKKESEKLLRFSSNTSVDYLKFKPVWPTAGRDFCNVSHWRQFLDGRILLLSFSDNFDDIKPIEDGVVRAHLHIGGYLMKPTPQGTFVTYIVQTDLKGTIPSTVANFVSNNQPMILATIQKYLADKKKNSNEANSSADFETLPSFQDIKNAFDRGVATCSEKKYLADRPATNSMSSNNIAAPVPITKVPTMTNKQGVRRRNEGESKLNKISFSILLLPFLLSYVVNGYRILAFVVGVVVSINYLISLHLGEPKKLSGSLLRSVSDETSSLPVGVATLKFPVELSRLLKYLDAKREENAKEITLTHVTLKACAAVIKDFQTINGYVVLGSFFPARNKNVDVSLSYDITEKESIMIKVDSADTKSIEKITEEILNTGKALRKSRYTEKSTTRQRILRFFPYYLRNLVDSLFNGIGSGLGISIPFLGIKSFPFGVCSVLISPSLEGESDVDIAMIPNTQNNTSSNPITVTIGGIRIQSILDDEKKLVGIPVLNYSVSVNTAGVSLADGRRFSAKLQQYLNNPSILDGNNAGNASISSGVKKGKH
eukprot:gene4414-6241_t